MTKYLADSDIKIRPEPETPLRNKLMVAASAGILALAAPGGLYGMRAEAQALPTGCVDDLSLSPNDGDGVADDGETIECQGALGPAGVPMAIPVGISTTANNLTVNVAEDQEVYGLGGPAISMQGSGTQTLSLAVGSIIDQTPSFESVVIASANDTITLTHSGRISSAGNGATGLAVKALVTGGTGNISVNSESGTIRGQLYAKSDSTGLIDLSLGQVSNQQTDGAAIDVLAGAMTNGVTIRTKALVRNEYGAGANIVNNGFGETLLQIYNTISGGSERFAGDKTGVTLKTTAAGIGSTISGYVDPNSGLRSGSVIGALMAIEQITNGGDILIENMASVEGGTQAGILARSSGGEITIRNIDSVTSEGGSAIDADTRTYISPGFYSGGGADISIQNVAIPAFDDDGDAITPYIRSASGIRAFSGTGNINIGADPNQMGSEIGDIYTYGPAIRAQSDSGTIDIAVAGNVSATQTGSIVPIQAIIASISSGTGAINIETQQSVMADDSGIVANHFGSGNVAVTTRETMTVGGDGIAVYTYGGNITIDSGGRIISGRHGIYADLETGGTATLMITGEIDAGALDDGVNLTNSGGGTHSGSSTVSVSTTIRGGDDGLYIDHDSLGATTVNFSGLARVIGETGNGIKIDNGYAGAAINLLGPTDPLSSPAGIIEGAVFGADLDSAGSAITVRNLTSIWGGTQAGLSANSQAGAITIENIDSVASEGSYAISADSAGGEISIQNVAVGLFDHDNNTATAALRSNLGIAATSGTGNINIGAGSNGASDEIGDLITTGTALQATSEGGNIDVTLAGLVDSTSGTGIDLNLELGGDATLVARGDITASAVGIDVVNRGSSDTLSTNTVTLEGRVYGGTRGVQISQQGHSADTTLQLGAAAEIIGRTEGVNLVLDNAANTMLVAGTVGGASRIQGGRNGLRLVQSGGDVTIENIGSVASETTWAIEVGNYFATLATLGGGGAGNVSIQNVAIGLFDHDNNAATGNIRSANGIRVVGGTGSINIGAAASLNNTEIGDVLTTGTGIYATSMGGPISVNVAGTIDSTAGYGIDLGLSSSGNVSVVTTGTVDTELNGIDIANGAGGNGTTTVSVYEDLASNANGIVIAHDAVGDVMLYLGNGADILGRTGVGVQIATSADQGGAISISGQQAGITGAGIGLDLETVNSNVTVRDLASVGSLAADGISVITHGGAITLENIASVVSFADWAIDAETRNADGNGGFAGGGANISIQNVRLPASANIGVPPGDSGNTPIRYSANGIRAYSGIGNINIGADTDQAGNEINNIYAAGTGIRAETDGGTIDIAVAGTITTTTGDGIYASSSSAGAITIAAQGELSTGGDGIDVDQSGLGAVSVTTQEAIAAGGRGIRINSDQAVGVTLSVQGDIDAVGDGINLYNRGGGAAAAHNIYVNAIVRGADGLDSGRYGEGSTTLTMSAEAEIIGETRRGVFLQVYGDTSTALIDGGGGVIEGATYGVFGDTDAASFTVKNLARVRGGTRDGIFVNSQGGAIIIENIDTVFSQSDWAIDAAMTGDGDVTINSVAVLEEVDANDPLAAPSRSANGLRASSQAGDITIGGATAATAIGAIYADFYGVRGDSNAGNISINATGPIDVVSGQGIRATTQSGAIEINATGDISALRTGLRAYAYAASAGEIDIVAGNVTTATNTYSAINVGNYGSQATTVTLTGEVQNAGNLTTVDIKTLTGADVTVTQSASILNPSGAAIDFKGVGTVNGSNLVYAETDDTLTLEGFVAADVLMGSGDDR
ncbi:MAG: hypothetical protein AAFR51_16785, partial [Pseudomonadota bacterium]